MKKRKFYFRTLVGAGLIAAVAAFPAFADNWIHQENGWVCKTADGYMQTGWYTDTDGKIYFLHPVGDGTRGRMVTGWNLIDGVWYYFNPTSDGTKGSLFMNRQTPDGYRVDASGAWVE